MSVTQPTPHPCPNSSPSPSTQCFRDTPCETSLVLKHHKVPRVTHDQHWNSRRRKTFPASPDAGFSSASSVREPTKKTRGRFIRSRRSRIVGRGPSTSDRAVRYMACGAVTCCVPNTTGGTESVPDSARSRSRARSRSNPCATYDASDCYTMAPPMGSAPGSRLAPASAERDTSSGRRSASKTATEPPKL